MAQNISSAVMQQRHEALDSLDDFPTPPWAARALIEALRCRDMIDDISAASVREPAANRGCMAETLSESFGTVIASDIFDYGAGYAVEDYLFSEPRRVDWTITNPPFRLAARFIEKAATESDQGFAVFVRSAFLEGFERHKSLWSRNPPSLLLQFAERVVLHRSRLAPKGSTATAYCWIVWADGEYPTQFGWIPPCRKRLERAGDYRDAWTQPISDQAAA